MSPSSLQRVSSLKLTFIVDNSIEWMTKLPPGFTSELILHLTHNPPVDERTGVPFVDLENYCCGAHGFSVLIVRETQADGGSAPHTVLFDTGPDSKSIIRNMESLQVPVLDIERVIVSHWHSDHTGGLLAFLKYRRDRIQAEEAKDLSPSSGADGTARRIAIDVHPDRPIARGIRPPTVGRVIGRLPEDPSFQAIEDGGALVETHAEGHTVAGNTVYVSGEIPRETYYEQGIIGGVRWVESANAKGEWVDEPDIMDERYAAMDVLGKGLVVFSACSHAGIVNVCKDAIKTFARPIYMIIGGLHLAGPELQERIAPTVDFLSNKLRPSPTYVLPMHCSGFVAKVALEEALGEGCVPAGVGICVTIEGDAAVDTTLFAPTIV